jgi:hypothetical protein
VDVVSNSAALFRRRARECRRMASEVKEPDWRNTLLSLAQDLEDEAAKIDAGNKPN